MAQVKPTVVPAFARSALKRLRASQPFNAVATGGVRWLMSTTGIRSELPVRHLHRMGEVCAPLPNGQTLKLWSKGDDWISNRVFWGGWNGYDPEVAVLFFHMAQRAAGVLDIGSYVGFYSVLAAHANPSARVVAFEPLPSIHERLRRNVALNALANVQCVNAAVGDENGFADFFHVTTDLPSSSSLSGEFMEREEGVTRSRVQVLTIDAFLEKEGIRRVDLVKLDTESTEPAALRGMRATLERDRPDIVCEVLVGGGTGEAIEELLRPLGYHFYLLTDGGMRRRDRVEGDADWFNYLFTTKPAEFWTGAVPGLRVVS